MVGSYQLLAATLMSALMMGFLPALWGRLRLAQSQALETPAMNVDRLKRTCLFLSLPLTLAAGWAVDAWGAHDILFAGSVLSALALAALGVRVSYESLRWLVVMVAAASACLTIATTVFMPFAFLGPDDPAASLNLGFVAVGVGYLVLPAVVDAFCRRLGFRTGMVLVAVFSLLPAVFVTFTSREDVAVRVQNIEATSVLSSSAIWLAALAAIFYFPLAGSLVSWTGDYLKNLGHDPRRIAYWHAGFWTIFLASRFVTGEFLVPGYEFWFVLVAVAASAVTLGNLAGAYGPTSARGLFFLAAFLGPVVPSLLGGIIRLSAGSAMAVAIVYVCGGAGALVLAPALASPSQSQSLQAGTRVPLAVTVLMVIPVLVLALTAR
jgi:hypothetical protein